MGRTVPFGMVNQIVTIQLTPEWSESAKGFVVRGPGVVGGVPASLKKELLWKRTLKEQWQGFGVSDAVFTTSG